MILKNVKLKTLLIFPPLMEDTLSRNPFSGNKNTPDLGIPTLVGHLKSKGYTKIDSITLRNNDSFAYGSLKTITLFLKKYLINRSPDIIGLSTTYYAQLPWAIRIANIVKKLNKKIFIVAGGHSISQAQHSLIAKPSNLCDSFDAIIVGDGQEPLEKLIYNLSVKKNLKDVPNLLLKDRVSNKFLKNKPVFVESKKDLKTKPCFDGEGIDTSAFIPIRASINCYWGKCTFCDNSALTRQKYMTLGVKNLIFLVKQLQKDWKQDNFFLFDDALPPAYFKNFAEELIRQKISIRWIARGVCIDEKFDEKLLKLLKQSGCSNVILGMESFSNRILKLMGKMHTAESSLKILKLLKKLQMEASVNIIFGFPTETKNDINKTLFFLKKYPHLYKVASVNRFRAIRDTYVYRHPQEFKLIDKGTIYNKIFITKDKQVPFRIIKKMIKKLGLKEKIIMYIPTLEKLKKTGKSAPLFLLKKNLQKLNPYKEFTRLR